MLNCNISGIDVNEKLIKFGNDQIYNNLKIKNKLSCKNEDEMFDIVRNSEAKTLSAIGVIEHLRHPHKLFDAFRESKIEFLLLCPNVFIKCPLENSLRKSSSTIAWCHTHLFMKNH